MKNIIIDGLSGAGKSILLNKLETQLKSKKIEYKVFYEDETFGEFTDEVKQSCLTDENKLYRLNNIIKEISNTNKIIILERFHFSCYALLKNWSLYEKIDSKLSKNNFLLILLTYNPDLILERALQHNNLTNKDLTSFIEYFGSLEKALHEYYISQENRKEALLHTKLDVLQIDTSEMNWNNYISIILDRINLL